ncbi:hypothetical protein KC887_02260, partial [Candidatus Kaiserbacteria bacterium]|nr:hypothetical protein [Candidatus Kaiserbacteria bacterium]
LYSDYLLGSFWIGLGLSTYFSSVVADTLTVCGPILVGILCMLPGHQTLGAYYILGFAVVVDRVVSYMAQGIWNPLFAWAILGIYVLRTGVEANTAIRMAQRNDELSRPLERRSSGVRQSSRKLAH